MRETTKGRIFNQSRARQQRDYSRLSFGGITPTDIDGLIEYRNKAYVVWELKYLDNSVPLGQRLAFERLADDLERSGKPAVFIIASHDTDDPNTDIPAHDARVVEYRWKGAWHVEDSPRMLEDIVKSFIQKVDEGDY